MNFPGRFQFRRCMCMLMRQNFSAECEKVLNKQINIELSACHEYLAMAYYFDRADVALPGVHKFFKKSSDEERTHAERIMAYMNKRGGRIVLEAIPAAKNQYGTLKQAMIDALCREKAVNEALLALHAVGAKENDPNLCDFIETHFLQEQVDAQKQLADYIRQIERCEAELGSYIFDINMKEGGMH